MHELRGGNEEEGPRRLCDGVLAAELRRPDEAQELVLGGLLERLHRRELRAARRERARLVDEDRIDAAHSGYIAEFIFDAHATRREMARGSQRAARAAAKGFQPGER
ncbi:MULTISPECIES: hypothetical protein [Sorangium]|uniref:hypothetical protein n=1 Tax=Sorangium TaxID=39643 RepID=UPI003D9C2A86